MGRRDVDQHSFGDVRIDPKTHQAAALHLADRIAAQHPTQWDDELPDYAGWLVAQDPTVRAAMHELLDAIGYTSKEQT
ncbi:hypothetical protein ACFWPQ_02090 [Streptomyces sp. NPDC058464]|uniref:hypothetical protein n=1 Tax=Streptomyces sp. NPDC058464 TaxID=3346511 RepID=UPI00364CE923